MKVATVVGARPQFVKAAVVSRELRKKHTEVLIHTGQHYDYNMSDVFFEELDIPKPDYNLGISGGSHGEMTGKMIIEIEKVLHKEQPDCLIVYGDTNSTMAGAIAAAKLHIPVCHIEAGCRIGVEKKEKQGIYEFDNPEEINRIVTDHIASLHLTSTLSGNDFLKKEGIEKTVHFVGDPMFDAFIYYANRATKNEFEKIVDFYGKKVQVPEEYYYLTCHRQENTDTDKELNEIFMAMEQLDSKVIYPVHPRNRERAQRLLKSNKYKNIVLVQPVGYLTSIALVKNAKKIVTDSGGLQREAFFASKQCVTIFHCWPETLRNNCNQQSRANEKEILEKLAINAIFDENYLPFGDGNAAKKIVYCIETYL